VTVGNEYLLSIGSHSGNLTMLMDPGTPSRPLTVERGLLACAVLSFALDSPVVPHDNKGSRRTFVGMRRNTVSGVSLDEYLRGLTEAASAADATFEPAPRRNEYPAGRLLPHEGRADYPPTDAVWRAVMAYWSALLSIPLPGRILNFWRAMEAVTTRAQRVDLLEHLPDRTVGRVWSTARRVPTATHTYGPRHFDVARVLRRKALTHRAALIAMHGSSSDALNFLYEMRRGKSAHADKVATEFDHLSQLALQVGDVRLLQFMARVAVERAWREADALKPSRTV
jgi:hypothetical protein